MPYIIIIVWYTITAIALTHVIEDKRKRDRELNIALVLTIVSLLYIFIAGY